MFIFEQLQYKTTEINNAITVIKFKIFDIYLLIDVK